MASPSSVEQGRDNRRVTLRNDRFRALRTLSRVSTLKAVRMCHKWSLLPGGHVEIWGTPTPDGVRAGFKGIGVCGSVHACPVCSAKIAAKRADEISRAVEKHEANGGIVAMITLTRPHEYTDDLDLMWTAQSLAWKAVVDGAGWFADQDMFGVPITRKITHGKRKGETVTENRIPFIRAVEVTRGRNGWHPHIHALLFLQGDPDLDALGRRMFDRWRRKLVSMGEVDADDTADFDKHGWKIQQVKTGASTRAFGEYLAKQVYGSPADSRQRSDDAGKVGHEVAGGAFKKGRQASRTPFEVLENVVMNLDNGDDPVVQKSAVRDLGIWLTWERASKGKRQITWSRGLRDWLGLEDEMTDEEIASEDRLTDESVGLALIPQRDLNVHYRRMGEVLREYEVWMETEYLPRAVADPGWAIRYNDEFRRESWEAVQAGNQSDGVAGSSRRRGKTRRQDRLTGPPASSTLDT